MLISTRVVTAIHDVWHTYCAYLERRLCETCRRKIAAAHLTVGVARTTLRARGSGGREEGGGGRGKARARVLLER